MSDPPPTAIRAPDDPLLNALCNRLAADATQWGSREDWPDSSLRACADAGVFRWFVPESWGGQAWREPEIVRGYLGLSQACLTTTFIITQFTGGLRRIVGSNNSHIEPSLIADLIDGRSFATVGISHLTTSRQHLGRPALLATPDGDDFILTGLSPWVTGATAADYIVTGATLGDGRQLLAMVATADDSVEVQRPGDLVALSASQTGAVHFHGTRVTPDWLLAGPIENVMHQSSSVRTGGLQTSTLALGLAKAAIEFEREQSRERPELVDSAERLNAQWQVACELLFELASGECESERSAELRATSNSLVLRATQAALVAAKGAGFTTGHPAGRWCREALFFLVWSCPQPVLARNLCEFAGIE